MIEPARRREVGVLGGVGLAASTANVAGVRVHDADVHRALDMLWAAASAGSETVFVLVNGQTAMLRRRDPRYARLLADEEVVGLPDGAPVSFGAGLLGYGRFGRCPGPDLFEAACARAAKDGTSIFLLGGLPGVVEALAVRLTDQFETLRIAGTSTPPTGEWESEYSKEACAAIRDSGARILWVGVSAPKQEVWAVENRARIGMPVVCVGAAFDFLSGHARRAPRWMRRIGLEWLFRLLAEPQRLWRRYLVGNAVFVWDLLRFGRRAAAAPAESAGNV